MMSANATPTSACTQFSTDEEGRAAALAALLKAQDDFLLNAPVNVPIIRKSWFQLCLEAMPAEVRQAVIDAVRALPHKQ